MIARSLPSSGRFSMYDSFSPHSLIVASIVCAVIALLRYGIPALLVAYAIRKGQPINVKAGKFRFDVSTQPDPPGNIQEPRARPELTRGPTRRKRPVNRKKAK